MANETNSVQRSNGGWISAVASGASGLLGGVMDAIFAKRNARINLEANKNLADYQYSKDMEAWNRQNEYNSPSSQMLRYKEAGLNPNMIYGSSASAGNATTLPRYQAPTYRYDYQPPNLTSVLQTYADLRLRQAQIDSVQQDVRGKTIENDAKEGTLNAWWLNRSEFQKWQAANTKFNALANPFGYYGADTREMATSKFYADLGRTNYQTLVYQSQARLMEAERRVKMIEEQLKSKELGWYVPKTVAGMFGSVASGIGLGSLARGVFGKAKPYIPEFQPPKFNSGFGSSSYSF